MYKMYKLYKMYKTCTLNIEHDDKIFDKWIITPAAKERSQKSNSCYRCLKLSQKNAGWNYFILNTHIQTGWPLRVSFPFLNATSTGYFKKVYRSFQVRPYNILKYLSIQKLPQKRCCQSIYLSNLQKKIILCLNFISNI